MKHPSDKPLENDKQMMLERERQVLLELGNDITRARDKNDLIVLFSKRIKGLYYFTHTIVTLIDVKDESYTAFLLDHSASAIRSRSEYQSMVTARFSLDDPFIQSVLASDGPISFRLADVMNAPKSPAFLRVNHEKGVQHVLMTTLRIEDKPIGFIHIYTDKLFNVERELARGNRLSYLELWKNMNFKTMVGIALRNSNSNIGLLWLSIDEINIPILQGLCAQISTAISNIVANEQILHYKQQLEEENDYLKEQLRSNFAEIVGNGKAMQEVYRLISLVSASNSTVLLLGETGTGKELIARAIHNASPRSKKLMIKVNCAAMPANLIESELFGHERGAFTGAVERRIGKFELADNSTLFLDENKEAAGMIRRLLCIFCSMIMPGFSLAFHVPRTCAGKWPG